jgi:hypothetical protein
MSLFWPDSAAQAMMVLSRSMTEWLIDLQQLPGTLHQDACLQRLMSWYTLT